MSGVAQGSQGEAGAASVGSALLLAFAGGAIDAFMYLRHGGTFAAAQTGNAVLCGVAVLERKGHAVLQHLLPILAFGAGVFLAHLLAARLRRRGASVGLAVEILGLLACSFLPSGFPELVYVPLVSLLASYQVATFRKAGRFSYNSTFITGDLRTAVVGLYEAFDPARRNEGRRQAAVLFGIFGSFVGGAMVSAMLAGRLANHTLWLPVGVLLPVLIRTLRAE